MLPQGFYGVFEDFFRLLGFFAEASAAHLANATLLRGLDVFKKISPRRTDPSATVYSGRPGLA